jgi:hypothetical protein
MANSSSDSANPSTESETSREMTPEFDSKVAYEACAPLHWDAEEWDFWAWSEDDESLTNGEDLHFILDGELEDEDDDNDVSSEEEDNDESTEEDLTAESFLHARSSDEDDDGDNGEDPDDGVDSDDSAGDDGSDGGSDDDDGDVDAVPPIKRHKFSGTYWW